MDKTDFILQDGASKLHIITDFDRTLTQAFVDGEYKSSLISVLYTEWYLSDHYQKTAQWYFDHYHPIEIDESIPLAERRAAMTERWVRHKQLLISEWLTRQHIYDAMQTHGVVLRSGAKEFFHLCAEKNIPVVIFSASGLGVIAIKKFLEKDNLLTSNVHIISNDFVRDDQGRAIDFQKPIIHSLNKGETILHEYDFADQLVNRPNIILMGDSIGDAAMANGSEYDHLLKIWFLNKDVEQKRKLYQEHFDVIIENDGDMDIVNEIIAQLT